MAGRRGTPTAGGPSPARGCARTALRSPSAPAPPARASAARRASGRPWPAGGWWPCSGCRPVCSRACLCWCAEDGARLRGIPLHLLDHCREVVETLLVAQPGHELAFDAAPVEVAVEVEQVRLQQRLVAVHRRARAEACHAGPGRVADA